MWIPQQDLLPSQPQSLDYGCNQNYTQTAPSLPFPPIHLALCQVFLPCRARLARELPEITIQDSLGVHIMEMQSRRSYIKRETFAPEQCWKDNKKPRLRTLRASGIEHMKRRRFCEERETSSN